MRETNTAVTESAHRQIPILNTLMALRKSQSAALVPNVSFPTDTNLRRISLSNPVWKIKLISEKTDNITPNLQLCFTFLMTGLNVTVFTYLVIL